MTLTKAIATPPEQNTQHVDLTVAEESARQAESNLNLLEGTRASLKAEFLTEGVRRIGLQVSEWNSFERVALLASVWNMFGAAPNAQQAAARDIFLYLRDTVLPKLGGLTLAELQQIDAAAAQPFAAVDSADSGWPA